MDALTLFDSPPAKPRPFLLSSGNSDLARDRIFTWTLPAWAGRFADGRTYNTCPEAGVCASLCFAYAPASSYKRFPGVAESHRRNLAMVLDTPQLWEQWMIEELRHRRYAGGAHVRIHDAGDFFSTGYAEAWWRIMKSAPHVHFYAYTKAVSRIRDVAARLGTPENFDYRFSLGGTEDHLIDPADRRADVFPDATALEAAGYVDQAESDLIAAGPDIKVGMEANRMASLRKRQGQLSFGELQLIRDDQQMSRTYRRCLLRLAALLTANAWMIRLLEDTPGIWQASVPTSAAEPEERSAIQAGGLPHAPMS